MGSGGYSRRDLLHLGGKLVMTIGAAKVMVALPGCGGDDDIGSGSGIGDGGIPPGGYGTLDECHAFGTYDYVTTGLGATYHTYYEGAYGCPDDVYPGPVGLDCYPDLKDIAPGYAYFCYFGHYSYVDYL